MSRRLHLFGALAVVVAVSGAACAHQDPVLKLPALQVGDPTFAATLSAYAGTTVVPGNRVEVLLNGDQIFPAKLRAIRAAKRSINYAQYVWEEGQASEDIVNALAGRCRTGLSVNVLLDAVGAFSMPPDYRQRMVDAGCRVESFRPLGPFAVDKVNYRNHRRILVADGRVGITGGSGTSGKWGGNGRQEDHWRDTDVWAEGPVVEQLQGGVCGELARGRRNSSGGPGLLPQSSGSEG